jgi:hypothetical protein
MSLYIKIKSLPIKDIVFFYDSDLLHYTALVLESMTFSYYFVLIDNPEKVLAWDTSLLRTE